MEIPQFLRRKPIFPVDRSEQLTRLQPILLAGCQHRVILFKHNQKSELFGFCGSAPQLRQDNRGVSDQSRGLFDLVLVASRPQIVDEYGGVEYSDTTHRNLRSAVCPRSFSSAS